ncbi:hypothetical protein KAF25_011233, partial [Fusarium avenaceum]
MASSSFQGSDSQYSDTDTFNHTEEGSISIFFESPYNDPKFNLPKPEDEKSFIFQSGLFIRKLLPINPTKERKMTVTCTICQWSQEVDVKGFQTSNFNRHIAKKHKSLPKERNIPERVKRSVNLPPDFFNKRTKPIPSFTEEGAIERILHFIIENNLSFRALNSISFQKLINYINQNSPTINKDNIKSYLSKTFNSALLNLNSQFKDHISGFGTFSLTFDIWSSSSSNKSYLGVIMSYLSPDFIPFYRLLSFEELLEAHTGLYIYTQLFS